MVLSLQCIALGMRSTLTPNGREEKKETRKRENCIFRLVLSFHLSVYSERVCVPCVFLRECLRLKPNRSSAYNNRKKEGEEDRKLETERKNLQE